MKIAPQEQKQAERLLQRNGIGFNEIESFSFMKRYYQTPRKSNLISKDKYGAGILTLHLKEGKEKAIYLSSHRHPTAVVHYLLSREIPFDNYKARNRDAETTIPKKTYCRSSLYLLYFASLFIVFAVLGCKMIASSMLWTVVPGIFFLVLSAILLYALLTRFGYLTLDNESLTVHSIGRTVTIPYANLRKVNFDYARERTFTYNMEILDRDYNYSLYYIGRVPRKKLKEITEYLLRAGIDTTCYIETDKRYYNDDYSRH